MPVVGELFQNNVHCRKVYIVAEIRSTYVLFLLRQEKYQKKATKGTLRKSMTQGMIATGNHFNSQFAARSTTPLVSPAASPSDSRKCSDFRESTGRKLATFCVVSVQKSGHFWTLDGDAAGVSKGVVLRAANHKYQGLPVAILP